MPGMQIKKVRRKRMRSYRKAKLFLWAFGVAGLVLGLVLIAVFVVLHHWRLAQLGIVYILIAGILLGVRGVLSYYDSERKRHRSVRSSPQSLS